MLLLVLVMFSNMVVNSENQFVSDKLDRVPEYHIQVIVQNSNENFWKNLKEGANVAAKELNVFVEFVPVSQTDAVTINTAVEKGIYANVDGLALQATESDTIALIKTLSENEEQIVAFENFYYNVKSVPKVPVIGSNTYDIGSYSGEMAIQAIEEKKKDQDEKIEVGVILNNTNNKGNEGYNNSIVQGIMYSLVKGNVNLTMEHIYTLDNGMFEAQRKLKQDVLPDVKNNELDVIICTDEKMTPSVAKMLVDNNVAKDIVFIGYGDRGQTLDYIKRGVIYGVLCPDAYKTGYYTVKQLVEKIKGEPISYGTLIDLEKIYQKDVEKRMADEE